MSNDHIAALLARLETLGQAEAVSVGPQKFVSCFEQLVEAGMDASGLVRHFAEHSSRELVAAMTFVVARQVTVADWNALRRLLRQMRVRDDSRVLQNTATALQRLFSIHEVDSEPLPHDESLARFLLDCLGYEGKDRAIIWQAALQVMTEIFGKPHLAVLLTAAEQSQIAERLRHIASTNDDFVREEIALLPPLLVRKWRLREDPAR